MPPKQEIELSRKFLLYWFPVLLYCFLIYIQSANPALKKLPHLPFMDKLLHFSGYALLGLLFFRALWTVAHKQGLKTVMLLSILFSSLYGFSDEIHQHFVPYRHADLLDLLADVLGSFCGVYAYRFCALK